MGVYLACEALSYGWGGITRVSEISGVTPNTIRQGIAEIKGKEPLEPSLRVRTPGGGRKKLEISMPDLDKHILQIIDGSTYGNPEKVLSYTTMSYTTMSLRTIQEKLAENYNEIISFRSIGTILEKLGYSILPSIPNATISSHIGGFSPRCTPLKGDSPSAGVRLDKIRLCTNLLRNLE